MKKLFRVLSEIKQQVHQNTVLLKGMKNRKAGVDPPVDVEKFGLNVATAADLAKLEEQLALQENETALVKKIMMVY